MIKKSLYVIAFLIFAVLIYHVFEYYSFTKQRNEIVQEKGQQTTALLKTQIDAVLSEIVAEGERLSKQFGANDYSKEQIEQIIKESSLKIPALQGVTACYEKFAFSGEVELYCPYYNKGESSYIDVGKTYDYTDNSNSGANWYTGVRDTGAKWVEPYFAAAAKDWYVDYGIPFKYTSGPKKGQIKGTITMSFLTSGFKNLVHSLSIGKTGFGIVTSTKGTFLSHPVDEYIGTKTLSEVKETEENIALIKVYETLLKGKSGHIEFDNPERKDKALFFYDKIPSSQWSFGLMFYKNELLSDTSAINERYIKMALLLSAFFLIIIAIYFNKDYLDRTEIWQLSVLATLLLIFNIVLIGYLEHTGSREVMVEESPPIADMSSLGSFINQRNIRLEQLKIPKSTPIPTGVFIQRMAFENSYNLNVGGTIWQKYPLTIVDSVKVGFRLPQTSPFAEASFIEEIYRKRIDATLTTKGYVLVGWDFRVTLQQYLNYEKFPFDKRHINIKIVPINNEDQLIFTPDLASYEFTNPSQKAGLNPNVKISGNKIMGSYFNYSVESYDTDFGFGSKTMFEEVPVLHFNINLRRILLNTFVTYLIPIFVTLIMMFILILACSKTEERQGIIEGMAAFFFVLIFSHIDMRKEIITADLIFMEYFYFITYGMIILSTWNLITYAKNKSEVFDFNDNQIFKASYFPFFFLCILVVMLSKFY